MDSFRHLETYHSTQERFKANIEQLVFASEVACQNKGDDLTGEICAGCPWDSGDTYNCDLRILRHLLGVTVAQHDPTQTTLQTPLMDPVQPVEWGRS